MGTLFILFAVSLVLNQVYGNLNILFANVTGTGQNARIHATCVSDDYNDAIAWIIPPQNKSLESITADMDLTPVPFDWKMQQWTTNFAYNEMYGPITDYTWEKLPIILTAADGEWISWQFRLENNEFELNFSFLGKSNANIYLCSFEEYIQKINSCFIFELGHENGKKSILKNCVNGMYCENILQEIKHEPIFSENHWRQISIRYFHQQLQVIINGALLISYKSLNGIEFIKYTDIMIRSTTGNALWKYHDYTFYEDRRTHLQNRSTKSSEFYWKSNQLCISFFARFKNKITLELYDKSQNLIKSMNYLGDNSIQWNYKIFNSVVPKKSEYFIILTINSDEIVAIRDMVIHGDCNTTEQKYYHSSSVSYDITQIKTLKCSVLGQRKEHLKILPINNQDVCQMNYEKQNTCTTFYNSTECPHQLICHEKICFCSLGYIGKYCEKRCEAGYHGCNCANKCGECIDGLCNPVNGKCSLGCINNYIEPYCTQKNLPVLADILSTQTDCITNCTITIYDKKLKYDGAQEPKYYYTRLFQPNRTITEGEIIPIEQNIIHFNNLIKQFKYNYQIVLCVANKKSDCFSADIETFQFETTCEEIHKNQIQIQSIDRLTTIIVTSYNASTHCYLADYYILVLNPTTNSVVYSKHLELRNSVSSLNVFTKYTLQLTKNNKISHNLSLITDESVPNEVNNFKIKSTSPVQLNVVWEEPFPVLGIITHYYVEWNFSDKRECLISNLMSKKQSGEVRTPAIELNDLIPYSIYDISIYAFTKKGRGGVVKTKAYTDASITINPAVFKYSVNPKDTSLEISLDVDCLHWNGPFLLNTNITCKQEWCEGKLNQLSTKIRYINDTVIVEKLLPYTIYSLDVDIHFGQRGLNSSYKLDSQEIITLPSVPNKIPFADVYTSSETTLSLRWSAPYPPTGTLVSFKINYGYNGGKEYTIQIKSNLIPFCKIWSDMFCHTLTDLENNKNYTITISAQNSEISSSGSVLVLYETTSIKIPERPLFLHSSWNESQNLLLYWQHPNKTNGPFLRFEVNINGQQFFHREAENLTYSLKTSMQCKPKIHQALVSIQTINSQYKSDWLSAQFNCPISQPSFKSSPIMKQITDNSITIFIPTIENAEVISNLYIILLTDQKNHTGDCRESDIDRATLFTLIRTYHTCWIIRHYEHIEYENIENTEVTVNINQMPEYNLTQEEYELSILITNNFFGEKSHNWYILQPELTVLNSEIVDSETSGFSTMWYMLLIIAGIILILGVLVWRHKLIRRLNFHDNQYSEIQPIYEPATYSSLEYMPPALPMKEIRTNRNEDDQCSQLVALPDFLEYVKNVVDEGELIEQHQKILKSTTVINHCHLVETAPECLEACYVDSPTCKKAYILCSAPTSINHYNFWEMIIKEKVKSVVLFANLTDIRKETFSKYWPDYRTNKVETYLDIDVSALSVTTYLNYEIHDFEVKHSTRATKISFFHFTNWAKRGTPMYPHNLTAFLQCIQKIEHSSEHPILVHNSEELDICASLFTLVDICIRQAQKDNHVDICNQVQKLRTQRSNSIETVEEYLFAHLILVEYISMPQHAYPCEYYPIIYSTLDDEKLEQEMRNISESMWMVNFLRPEGSMLYHNEADKNRDRSIKPDPSCCVFLRPVDEDDSCYINAIFVDGYQQTKKFIVTQHPLESTVDDFWRLVVDSNVQLIISLQPEYDVDFWMNNGELITDNDTSINHLKSLELSGFNMYTLAVNFKNLAVATQKVNLIEVAGWPLDEVVPQNLDSLLTTRLQMHRLKCKEFSSVLVMCRNGATASGLFIAMCNLLDCIEYEHVVDVCTSVRNIRSNRQQFVTEESQLRALFDIATLFLNNFQKYANFGSTLHLKKMKKKLK